MMFTAFHVRVVCGESCLKIGLKTTWCPTANPYNALQELDSEFVVKLFEAQNQWNQMLPGGCSKLLCIGVEGVKNPSGNLFLRFFVHHISSCWFSSWWKMTWESCELSKTKMEQGFHYLGFIARWQVYHCITTVWVDWHFVIIPRYMKSVRGHLSPQGSPSDIWATEKASSHVGIQCPAMMLSDGPRKDIRSLCWQLVKGLDVCHATWQHRFFRHWWEIFKLSLQESTRSYSRMYIIVRILIYTCIHIRISSHIFTKEVRSTWVSWQFGRYNNITQFFNQTKRSKKNQNNETIKFFFGTSEARRIIHRDIKSGILWAEKPLRVKKTQRFWEVEASKSPDWQWDALEVGRLRTSKSLCGWET